MIGYGKYIFIILVLSFWSTLVTAQDSDHDQAKILIKKVKKLYDTATDYRVEVNYTMYDGATSSKILEQYSGTLIKKGTSFYSKIHNTESLQIAKEYIRVNHDEKAIVYAKQEQQNKQITGVNLEELFKNFAEVIVTENTSAYIITASSPPISQSPYNTIVLEISNTNYNIQKQTIFFSNQIPVKTASGTEKLTSPRLEIVFSNFSTNGKIDKSRVQLSSYVVKKTRGYRPSEVLKDYQFIDTTIQ